MAGEDKTEKASPKRRKELRKKGTIARSAELPQGLSLLALVIALPLAVRSMAEHLSGGMSGALQAAGHADLDTAGQLARQMLVNGLRGLILPVALVALSSVVSSIVVTRERPNFRAIRPRVEALSPKNGLKRIFSKQGLVETARTSAKLSTMILLGFLAWRSGVSHLIAVQVPLETLVSVVGHTVMHMLFEVAGIAVAIGVVDAWYARRRFSKQSKMTKQEVKDESKQSEANPHMRGAVRAKQRKISRMRMIAAVGGADVVLTNPTHYAVALSYAAGSAAPQVVAKGSDAVAGRIRDRARECDVPIVANKPLARALHSACDVGDSIPVELYRAVAEILAVVYAARRRRGLPAQRTPARPQRRAGRAQGVRTP